MSAHVIPFPKAFAREQVNSSPEHQLLVAIFNQLPHGRKNMVRFNLQQDGAFDALRIVGGLG